MITSSSRVRWGFLLAFTLPCAGLAQTAAQTTPPPLTSPNPLNPDARQVAEILGLESPLEKLRGMQTQAPCSSIMSPQQMFLRQGLTEVIQASALEVDAVLAEIDNERNELGDLRTELQTRRDHTVALLNSAALITGSGLAGVVTATQFTTFSTTTQNAGNGVLVGAGVTSTVLSLMSLRARKGPRASVGEVPNMLAPLFSRTAVLHAGYPPSVFQFLESVPPGSGQDRRTRLEQLKDAWIKTGRIEASGPAQENPTIVAASTSMEPGVKISIKDLNNRIDMLGDVSGRVSLMKRDLALLMASYTDSLRQCLTANQPGN